MKIIDAVRSAIGPKEEKKRCCAVVVAAGRGERMNSSINKQFIEVSGKPILAYCLETLQSCSCIEEIVLVAREEELFNAADLVKKYGIAKVKQIVRGGETRQASVMAGLSAVKKEYQFVAVHDGARPFVLAEDVERTVFAAFETGAAALGVRLVDTIKECDINQLIVRTVDRSRLWKVQTPQVFATHILWSAYGNAAKKEISVTDECMAVEKLNIKIKMIEGSGENIKITMPDDLAVAEAILSLRGERG